MISQLLGWILHLHLNNTLFASRCGRQRCLLAVFPLSTRPSIGNRLGLIQEGKALWVSLMKQLNTLQTKLVYLGLLQDNLLRVWLHRHLVIGLQCQDFLFPCSSLVLNVLHHLNRFLHLFHHLLMKRLVCLNSSLSLPREFIYGTLPESYSFFKLCKLGLQLELVITGSCILNSNSFLFPLCSFGLDKVPGLSLARIVRAIDKSKRPQIQ
mmetsp:Transcript_41158/g.74364  ORF Transcript_41158/g.74364 Transcript_41158/m.74364 type:complete len:210 (+) Transcript_41158:219-848(+)